jgi:hypothetical protein
MVDGKNFVKKKLGTNFYVTEVQFGSPSNVSMEFLALALPV